MNAAKRASSHLYQANPSDHAIRTAKALARSISSSSIELTSLGLL